MSLTHRSLYRNCAFVNFTNIANAIKAIDGVKTKPDYTNLRIAHGKDRCANPPRSGPQGGSGGRRGGGGGRVREIEVGRGRRGTRTRSLRRDGALVRSIRGVGGEEGREGRGFGLSI